MCWREEEEDNRFRVVLSDEGGVSRMELDWMFEMLWTFDALLVFER